MAKILIMDDDKNFTASTLSLLAGEGHEIVCAGSPAEGLSLIEKDRPSLIVLDPTMQKDEDGLVFAHSLIEKGISIPIILLTNVAAMAGASFEKAAEITVEAYADKPLDGDKLKAKVKAILSR